MASNTSQAPDFLELLRKSGLVPKDRLERWLQETTRTQPLPAAGAELSTLLVREGLLTPYQSARLLEGKWQHFIVKNKYKILTKLGEGGWSSVFLCEHLTMNRRLALKVLLPKLASNAGVVQRFLREAAAVGSLNHPNIVHAFDFDCDGNLYFLATEYVEGVDLNQLVRKHGPLDIGRSLSVIAQAAAGLQYAFQAGWVHRDIKPSNLLVDAAGRVKILDLGLARLFHDDGESLTQQFDKEATLGTADYMAPEQAIDSHDVDIRADIYSLGATLYFLLAGKAPFADCSAAQKLMMHLNRAPRPIRDLRPEVSKDLAAIVERMLAKNPAERFQTPAEVLATLRALPEFPAELPVFQTAEVPTAVGEATVILSSTTGLLPPPGPKTEPNESVIVRRQKQQTTTRRRWIAWNVAGGCMLLVLVGVVLALIRHSQPRTSEAGPVVVPVAEASKPAPLRRRPFRIFDGAPKTIVVVNGTYGGHVQLKSRLIRQPGGERVAVKNQTNAPVSGPRLGMKATPPAWCPKSKLDKSEGPVVYIVLGGAGVGAVGNNVRLPAPPGKYPPEQVQTAGLTLLQASVEQAQAQGIDVLFLCNAHYERDSPGGAQPYPALLQAHNRSELGQRHPAVDLCTPFQSRGPLALGFDGVRPSEGGRELLAHLWFTALCAWDGVAVPPWSEALVDQAFTEEQQRRRLITNVVPRGGESYRIGDSIPIAWSCDPQQCSRVLIQLVQEDGKVPRAFSIVPQVKITGPTGGSVQWVIPPTLKQTKKDITLEPGKYRIVVQKIGGLEWGASEGTFTIMRR
jgi:serine/threonine protein kinase